MQPTKGTQLFRDATTPRITINKLAAEGVITRQRLRTIAKGGEPTASEMAELKRRLEIPLEAWTEPTAEIT